jgi:hypothetical protein
MLLSIHSISDNFRALSRTFPCFFAVTDASLYVSQIGIVCKLKLLAVIHEMGKCQIWGYAAVAALCDSNSEVPVRESNVTLPFVLLLLCVLVPINDARD